MELSHECLSAFLEIIHPCKISLQRLNEVIVEFVCLLLGGRVVPHYRAAGRSGAAGRSLWFYTKNGSFSPISQTFSNSSRAFIIIDVPHRVRSSADDLGRSFYHNQFEKLLRTAPLGLSTTSDFTHGHTDIQNHHSAYDSRRTAWVWPQTASRKFSVPQKVISRTRLLRPIFLGSASRIFNYYTLCKRRT